MNVKVDFTLCNSLNCAMHVATVHTYTVHTPRNQCKSTHVFTGKTSLLLTSWRSGFNAIADERKVSG